jgi:hypothetical protein
MGMAKFAYISQKHSIDAQVVGYEEKTGIKITPSTGGGVGGALGGTIPPMLEEKEKEKEEVKVKEQYYNTGVLDVFNSVVNLFPNSTQPKTEKQKNDWKEEIRKLIEIDKHAPDEIIRLIKWARADSFWSSNFLSIPKLRKKNNDGVMYAEVFKIKATANHKNNEPNRRTTPQERDKFIQEWKINLDDIRIH